MSCIYSVSNFDNGKRVDEASRERIAKILQDFDNVVVSFSGGKDSTAMLDLTVKVAHELRLTDKLHVNYFDVEAETPDTHQFIADVFNYFSKGIAIDCNWHAGHWTVRNATKKYGHGLFTAYDTERAGNWLWDIMNVPGRKLHPEITGKTITYWRDVILRQQATEWTGKTANLIAITKFESLHRLLATTKERKGNYNAIPWSTVLFTRPEVVNLYPLFDWRAEDVIKYCQHEASTGYSSYYDKMAKATGLPWSKIRTENVLHGKGLKNLPIIEKLYPEFYAKMVAGELIGDEWGDKHAKEGLPRAKSDGTERAEKWSELL